MNIYTVSFFCHRHLSDPFVIEARLQPILRDFINTKEYVEFLVGRDGEFDQLVSSSIRRAKESYAYGNVSHILVLPYERADYRNNRCNYEAYYDEVEICPDAAAAHPKAAIFERNKCMIDRSDLVICAIEHKSGGAYKAVQYAKKQGKQIIYLICKINRCKQVVEMHLRI